MKETGECPKCQNHNIWNNSYLKESTTPYSPRRWIMVQASNLPTRRKYAFKDEYVCLDCGYSETFIDSAGIETIKEYGYPEDK